MTLVRVFFFCQHQENLLSNVKHKFILLTLFMIILCWCQFLSTLVEWLVRIIIF